MTTYKIVRFYKDRPTWKPVDRRGHGGLTLEQAQKHCSHDETSSSTCITPANTQHTAIHGPWFDGYTEE